MKQYKKLILLMMIMLTGILFYACGGKSDETLSEKNLENDIDIDIDMLEEYVLKLYNTTSLKQALVETQDILKFNEFTIDVTESGIISKKTVNNINDLPDRNSVWSENSEEILVKGLNKTILGGKFNSTSFSFIENEGSRNIFIVFDNYEETDFEKTKEKYNYICQVLFDKYGAPIRIEEESEDNKYSSKAWESTALGRIEVIHYHSGEKTAILKIYIDKK